MKVDVEPPDGTLESLPGWITAGERCLSHLLEAVGSLRRNELPPVLDADFLLDNLGEALTRLFEAFRLDADPPLALREAVAQLDRAGAALRIVQDQEPTIAELISSIQAARTAGAEAAERSIGVVWSAPGAVDELRASSEWQRLHPRVFPPLVPELTVIPAPDAQVTETPVEPPRPGSFSELEAALSELRQRAASRSNPDETSSDQAGSDETSSDEATPPSDDPPSEPSSAQDPPLTEQEFLQQQSRACFEDLTMLVTQRAPQLGEYWRDIETLELRMRACIDAIASLGRPGLARLTREVLEAPTLDPSRLAALTLLCGSVDGRDSLALAEWTFQELLAGFPDAAAELHEAFGEGLGLAPHPGVSLVCERMLRSDDVNLRALALDVLGWRGEATTNQLLDGLADEPLVAAVALPIYVSACPADLRDRIDESLRRGNRLLTVAAWQSMVLAGDPRVNGLLHEQLRGESAADAARLLGIHAERRDADLLLEEAAASPTPALVEALGFAGSPSSVPLLIGLLDVDDFELQLATSTALIRITGIELWEEVRLPAERVQDEQAGAALTDGSPRRNDEPEASEDTIELPTLRSEPWRAYWHQYGGHFDSALRYRRGRPHQALVLIDELMHCRASRRDRQTIGWELTSRLKHPFRFDPRSWVNRQWLALEAAREMTTPSTAGSWALPTRR